VPYIISITIGADGLASVFLQDTTGRTLGSLNAMPVGTGPFNVVLAGRRFGPTFANWNSVQLTSQQPAVAVAGPPETPTLDYFQAHLSPYGQWVDVPGVGLSWIPAEANNYGWRPYMDSGHWEMTDAGWYWQSDYPWGDMAFHYGRWIKNEFTADRWAWVPGYDWAPSWVSWREGAGGLGWAPLPWGVEFRVGSGLYWHGALMVDGVGLGLGFDAYVFVGTDHFWEHDYHTYVFDRTRARDFYEHSQFHAGYKMEGGHLMAEGLGREHMREITHHEVVEHKASELRKTEVQKNFAKRTVEHKELAHPAEHPKPTARAETREHTTGTTPERKGATNSHPGSAAPKGHPSPTIGGAKGTSSPSSTNGPGSKPHG
jgi:hypothetical protein